MSVYVTTYAPSLPLFALTFPLRFNPSFVMYLRDTRMAHWGDRRRLMFINQQQDSKPEHSYSISKEEDLKDEDKEVVECESPVMSKSTKRRLINNNGFKEMKIALSAKKRNCKNKAKKHDGSKDRWSAERYKLAEQSMLAILKAEGATFGNAISRSALRMEARKHICDTGLLDHLLKHVDGKVAPGGTERFRRWFSTNGIMEYWLESSDLDNIRKQAGVQDPYWIPPPSEPRPGGGPMEDYVSAVELNSLKEEIENMKRDMQELLCKKHQPYGANQVEDMFKEMVKWKADSDQTLKTVLNSWKGIQDMKAELMALKAKVDQQLVEFKSSLSRMQDSKHYIVPSTQSSERWKDLLESTNLDDELISWFESNNLVDVEPEVLVQDPCLMLPLYSKPGDIISQVSACATEVELLKKEGIDTKSDVQNVVLKQKDEQAIFTPDSCTTANSLSDLHNSSFQENITELLNWKAEVDQKLSEISNSVICMIKHQNN